ncbi:MAG: inositol-3-phosphate synthase [Planctomycetales bacterium]|nr:inositol-3-phosphate synthase [Planctomycetales bacterium]
MSNPRVGLWIIGARGGVSVSALCGWSALRRGSISSAGLVTETPFLQKLPLCSWDELVIGGHEIRSGALASELDRLRQTSGVIAPHVAELVQEDFASIDARIRPGTLWKSGPKIASLAGPETPSNPQGALHEIERLQGDLQAFRDENGLNDVVVMNLASTEAGLPDFPWPTDWEATRALLESPDVPLSSSSLYAIAALDLGMPYVNFTPSTGACLPGIEDLACQRSACHAGRDGKTGETLLKSVLAPMFAARRLEVMSWVGHNIFGNLDGKVLDDPAHKATKVQSKDALLGKILGYAPQTLISIEHIESLGDWKTAWDHIHFRGFLDTPMTLQFTWQGCDSMLAAPLVLDLVRLTHFASKQGEIGPLRFLSSFFKSPVGNVPQAFADQFRDLETWAAEAARSAS